MGSTPSPGTHEGRRALGRRGPLLLASAAIILLLPCLGLMGSSSYLWARQRGAFSRWHSLGTPPRGAEAIVTGDADVVYVRVAGGALYGCRQKGVPAAKDCWVEARQPLSVDPEARVGQTLFRGEPKPPPGTVVDTLQVTVFYPEDAYETRYAVLGDGSVWKWEYDVGAYVTVFIVAIGPLAGMMVALVAVVALWLSAGRRSRRALS